MTRTLMFVVLVGFASHAFATVSDVYPFDSAADRERFQTLTEELRCPKCQNQDIADSEAPIASDMRDEVYRMVRAGADNEAIVDSLVARFGEFVRYKPRLEKRTLILWATPPLVILIGVLMIAVMVIRSRRNSEQATALTPEQRERAEKLLREHDAR